MSKVYVATLIEGGGTPSQGVFGNPLDAVNAIRDASPTIYRGFAAVEGFDLGSKIGEGELLLHAPYDRLSYALNRVYGSRHEAPHYFPAVKERYKTAEELFEARRNNHAMMDDVLRGFSAIMRGLFSDEEIVTMYEGGEG